jgi:dTDP-4-amino-4,6-dideoxygalactose transaminase
LDVLDPLQRWVTANFPNFRHVYWGISGATMLGDALRQSGRRTLILPAFICHSLSDMARDSGVRLVHVDVDRSTMRMNRDQLERCLAERGDGNCLLLVDHPFGYPCPSVAELRAKHPELLIVEDCVRALGAKIDGEPVGWRGDWTLLSLYKTIPGNDHGAILLTRSRYDIRSGPPPRVTLRPRLATWSVAQRVNDWLKRSSPIPPASGHDLEGVPFVPVLGTPNRLVLERFRHEVERLEENVAQRAQAAREIHDALKDVKAISFIRTTPGSQTSGYFLSFTVPELDLRNCLLAALHRQGLFLFRTWQAVPAYFRCYRDTFPFGSAESVFLAQHVLHVPIIRFLDRRSRERLVRNLREFLKHA